MNDNGQFIVEGGNVRKNYDTHPALNGVDFYVRKGEIAGFLGPNGAGKTTLIKLITCTSFITGGTLRVFGIDVNSDVRRIKEKIGVVPQENNLDPDFTVYENMKVYSRYFFMLWKIAKEKIEELLGFVSLTDRKNTMVNDLSGGMKRRLIIARSLINDPDIIILDEPTTGLDPQARRHIWTMIRDLKKRGKTIILTTHYMEEAESLCDRVYIMDKGAVLAEGKPAELIHDNIGNETVEISNCDAISIAGLPGKKVTYGDKVFIHAAEKREVLEKLVNVCADVQFVARPSNLEDLFIYLTGRELKE